MNKNQAYIIFGTIGAVLLWWVIWSVRQPVGIANLDSRGTNIVAFGDSLIAGYGSTAGNDLISDLSARIGQPIINMGHKGDTSAEGLARIEPVLATDPKIVILLFGGNDFLQNVKADVTFNNLAKMIDAIQNRGSAVLLLGVRGGLFTDIYEQRFAVLAQTKHAAFVPNVLSGLIGKEGYMYDPVHPNDSGYSLIADRVEPVLRDMLKK